MIFRQNYNITAALIFALITVAGSCQAGFFRWKDDQGKTHYGDQPNQTSKQVTIHPGHAYYQIKNIYDGDTLTLSNGQKIRLLGINTPEIDSRYRAGEPGGEEARNWLRKQLKHKKVRLEKGTTKRDKYGRLLAHIFTQKGEHLNLKLVKRGLAVSNIYPPNLKYAKALLGAQQIAEQQKQGIWGMAAYQPKSITAISKKKNRGWGRFTGKVLQVKRGRKFDRLIFSRQVDVRLPTENRALFPPLSQYIGKQLEVRGWPSRRKKHYSILVLHPSALALQPYRH